MTVNYKNLIEIKGLCFGYGKPFFAPFDFELHAGEVVALLGPNGTGKSTFLKVCSGEFQPVCGEVLLLGKPILKLSALDRSKRISRVRPTLTVPSRVTVREFVSLGRSAYASVFDSRSEHDFNVIDNSLATVDAIKFASRTLSSLSDGERARVFLAEALARETPVILLDEPTAFLDVPHVISLFKMLKQIAVERNCGILICTHQVDYALKFADRILSFDKDVFIGTSKEALEQGALRWAAVE